MNYIFKLAPDDLAWTFEMNRDGVKLLLANPRLFIQSHFEKPIVFGDGPLVLNFQYGPFAQHRTYVVHGISGTNIASIRCPPLHLEDGDLVISDTVKNTEILTSYIREPSIAFAHFDLTDDSGSTIGNVAHVIRRPDSLFIWMNEQTQSGLQKVRRSQSKGLSDIKIEKKPLSFVMSSSFRIILEINQDIPKTLTAEEQPPQQCTKVSGTYTSIPSANSMVVEVDEVRHTFWSVVDPSNILMLS